MSFFANVFWNFLCPFIILLAVWTKKKHEVITREAMLLNWLQRFMYFPTRETTPISRALVEPAPAPISNPSIILLSSIVSRVFLGFST